VKTPPNKPDMDKAIKEALKRVERKEPQFQTNVIQATNQYNISQKTTKRK
jgi:hypothetical protein